MALLLSDIHLPALITSTLSEHTQYKSLPWNNLDQLSCLWGGKFVLEPDDSDLSVLMTFTFNSLYKMQKEYQGWISIRKFVMEIMV